jgi:hypothetical protein
MHTANDKILDHTFYFIFSFTIFVLKLIEDWTSLLIFKFHTIFEVPSANIKEVI